MDNIFKELGKLELSDSDELFDILSERSNDNDEEENDEDEEFNPDEEFDFNQTDVLADIELVGKTFWKNISEFGDKTREMATDLVLRFIDGTFGGTHKLPTYESKPMSGESVFDLDIDSTIEAIMEEPTADITPRVFERKTNRNPVLLLMDTSFSMNGHKIMIAGITIGVLSRLIPSKDLAVLGFSKEPYFIKKFDEEVSTYHMISRIMKLLPRGNTNLSKVLEKGSELIFPYHPHGRLILLSDADPTAGKNPIQQASKLHQIDLMLFPDGNTWLAKKIVFEAVKGRLFRIKQYDDIPQIIKDIFSVNT